AIFEKATENVTVTEEHFAKRGFDLNPVWQDFVATPAHDNHQEMILVLALYYIRYSTWKGQMLYLEDLLITADHRGKGIGKALFERVIQETKERKLRGMTWRVLDWNTPAIDFYKKYHASLDGEWINGELLF